SGDFMSRGQHKATKAPSHRGRPLQKIFIPALLCALVPLWLCVDLTAQTIYAENQIPARGVEVAYTVTIKNPASHLYDVQMSIKGIRETSLSISMPAWSPGIYRIENYACNIQDFRASTIRNQPLKWEQTDKQTWRIVKQAVDDVEVQYQVFS